MISKFDKIRPYSSVDLAVVLKSLVNNKEFIDTLVSFRFPHRPKFTKPILALFMKLFVTRKLAPVIKLSDFQRLVEPYMQRIIKQTTTGLTVSGLAG
ncbi:MAG: hypothetical protein ACJA0G_002411, partial [Kangiellaceae bacterium]